MALPPRERAAHAGYLIQELAEIEPQARQRTEEQRAQGIDAGLGIYLVFESEPNFELKCKRRFQATALRACGGA
ncbi:hypothetical protein J2S22_000910 [Rhodoplanes tepidamans]|nr:hypothetical protein [Rhodoplanes tepidamans]